MSRFSLDVQSLFSSIAIINLIIFSIFIFACTSLVFVSWFWFLICFEISYFTLLIRTVTNVSLLRQAHYSIPPMDYMTFDMAMMLARSAKSFVKTKTTPFLQRIPYLELWNINSKKLHADNTTKSWKSHSCGISWRVYLYSSFLLYWHVRLSVSLILVILHWPAPMSLPLVLVILYWHLPLSVSFVLHIFTILC